MSASKPVIEAPAVSVIGGLLARPGTVVGPAVLHAIRSRMTPSSGPMQTGGDPVGLFGVGAVLAEDSADAWVVADMDLLNAEELASRSGLKPGETGLISRLYAMEGVAFVRRLRGAFALALWDRRRRQLLLATDHFGVRRLYYTTTGPETVFASRASGVLGGPGVRTQVDPRAIYDYLNFRFMPAPGTPFAGVRRLPPGCLLVAGPGHTKLQPFWDMSYPEQQLTEERASSQLYRLTHQAVAEAMNGLDAKRTGAFLSGGTDSSTVVGLMTYISREPVNAFSIGFNEHPYDEMQYAKLAAERFGAKHYTRTITSGDAFEALPRLVEAYDEPFGNNSMLGTFLCAQLAREHGVTRLLAGDGGDEIFGGNERYRMDEIFARYGRLPTLLRRGVMEPILLGFPDGLPSLLGKAQRYIRRANIPNPRRFYSYEFFVAQNARELLTPEFCRMTAPDAPWLVLEEHFHRVQATSELNRLLYLDLKLTIGDNDLFKVTRTAELAGLAVRFPLLALPLVEFTGTLPAAFKLRGLEKRHLFKRAFRVLLPREILTKRKHGFGVPTADWLKNDARFRGLARDTLLSTRALQRGYFRREALERLFALHTDDSTPFYGDMLWSFLMLELWHQRHLDGSGAF